MHKSDHKSSDQCVRRKIGHAISLLGFCSRRKAEQLVLEGRVQINGVKISTCSSRIESTDKIAIDGTEINRAAGRIFLLHKPIKYLTTHKSQKGYKNIFDLFTTPIHLTFIGRLDYMSEGLVILTNVPKLVNLLSSSKYQRIYEVYVDKIGDKFMRELRKPNIDGMDLLKIQLITIEELDGCYKVRLGLREGKNREIRKVCEKCGMKVLKLKKVQHGPFSLGDLKPGQIKEVNSSDFQDLLL